MSNELLKSKRHGEIIVRANSWHLDWNLTASNLIVRKQHILLKQNLHRTTTSAVKKKSSLKEYQEEEDSVGDDGKEEKDPVQALSR